MMTTIKAPTLLARRLLESGREFSYGEYLSEQDAREVDLIISLLRNKRMAVDCTETTEETTKVFTFHVRKTWQGGDYPMDIFRDVMSRVPYKAMFVSVYFHEYESHPSVQPQIRLVLIGFELLCPYVS